LVVARLELYAKYFRISSHIAQTSHDKDPSKLALHLHRIGHHIRQTIVEQARAAIGQDESSSSDADLGVPEPIPESQDEINAQADAALKDLFPRIPNFDRQMVIEHAFKKVCTLLCASTSFHRLLTS